MTLGASSRNEVMNSVIVVLSFPRPAIRVVPLHVGRRRARTREEIGRSAEGGVGGGVANDKCDSAVAEGVAGRWENEVWRRNAVDSRLDTTNLGTSQNHLQSCRRDGERCSVLLRRSERGVSTNESRGSTRSGAMFSLLLSPS